MTSILEFYVLDTGIRRTEAVMKHPVPAVCIFPFPFSFHLGRMTQEAEVL